MVECPICLEEIKIGSCIKKENAFCKCSHIFCKECVAKYVEKKRIRDITCPICREKCSYFLDDNLYKRRYMPYNNTQVFIAWLFNRNQIYVNMV